MKALLLFPHKLRSEPCRQLVTHYLTLASRHIRADLEIVPYTDRTGQVPARLLTRVREQGAVFLSERGRTVRSEWFRDQLQEAGMTGRTLLFVVGGAEGLPPALERACARKVCLSQLTLPHELALTILAEQLWRAASMIAGHPYHK